VVTTAVEHDDPGMAFLLAQFKRAEQDRPARGNDENLLRLYSSTVIPASAQPIRAFIGESSYQGYGIDEKGVHAVRVTVEKLTVTAVWRSPVTVSYRFYPIDICSLAT
jgi:hypothetical protein